MTFEESNDSVVFYYLSLSEIWLEKRGGLIREGTTVIEVLALVNLIVKQFKTEDSEIIC